MNSEKYNETSRRQTRVLFLAGGYSIHAKRRIQLFTDDPRFAIAVVSPFDYNFLHAENVLLSQVRKNDVPKSNSPRNNKDYKRKKNIREIALRLWEKIYVVLRRFEPLRILYIVLVRGRRDLAVLKNAVKEFKPDIVFLQTLLYPSYLAYFLPRSLPFVITFWNGDVTWWAKENGIDRLIKKQIVTYGVRRAKAITVNSQAAFNACLDYGAQAEKIHLLQYPGVDLNLFKPLDKEEARKKLGITAGKVVFCPRGLGGYLNSDIIVESAAYVIRKYPDTLFLFVSGAGSQSVFKQHKKRAEEIGAGMNFRWEGHISWEEMPYYYNASDVMISISSNDSLPNCMLEAMACKIPLVMGDIPQIRAWVTDGANGFLVAPRDTAALSKRIVEVFDNKSGMIDSFTDKNLDLINREMDSERNTKRIKDIVHRLAVEKL
jgi:glycosyltransferase involved in cell wall biosynthesis